jgi:hypothetical protein
MNIIRRIRRIRRIAGVLTGLACAWLGLAAAAPAAFAAMSVPPPSGGSAALTLGPERSGWNKHPPLPGQGAAAVAEHHESHTDGLPAPLAAHIHQLVHQASDPIPVHTVVVGGMPGWQIALIAAAAALVAATVAVLVNRARATRRKSAAAAT